LSLRKDRNAFFRQAWSLGFCRKASDDYDYD
jgi:hypothetical protein